MRHDLSPKETSQVIGFRVRNQPVGHQDIEIRIIIEIAEQATPGPPSHHDFRVFADVLKRSVAEVSE